MLISSRERTRRIHTAVEGILSIAQGTESRPTLLFAKQSVGLRKTEMLYVAYMSRLGLDRAQLAFGKSFDTDQ